MTMTMPLEQKLCTEGERLREIFRTWQPSVYTKNNNPSEILDYYRHKLNCQTCRAAKWHRKD